MRQSTRSTLALALAACATSLAACEPELGPTAFEDQIIDAGTEDVTATELGGGRGAGDMNGTWLMVHEQSNCVTLPGASLSGEALSVTFEIVNLTQEGNRLYEDRDICAINLYPVLGFDNVFPIEASRSSNPILIDDSYVTGLEVGSTYVSGYEHQLFGVTMDDPTVEPMPESAEDTRVTDGDGDGNPGTTILVAGDCGMWISQRSSIRYFGRFVTPNQIAGESATLYGQTVLGSSTLLCRIPREVTPNDPAARFELSRIDGRGGAVSFDDNGDGTIDCDEVLSRQESLWTYRDPDDSNCGG